MLESKKSEKADIEYRRTEMFLASLVLVLSFLFAALEWNTSVDEIDSEKALSEIIEEIDFSKLKKNRDMITAISASDNPQEVTNVKPVDVALVKQNAEPLSSKLVVGSGDGEIPEAKVEEVQPQILENDKDSPEGFQVIEELPEFPGGATAFMKWITANLKYPRNAQDANVKGRVVVSFIVTADGDIKNLKIEKSNNRILARAVIETMEKMPRWKPGSQNGKPCSSMIAVPVNFEL